MISFFKKKEPEIVIPNVSKISVPTEMLNRCYPMWIPKDFDNYEIGVHTVVKKIRGIHQDISPATVYFRLPYRDWYLLEKSPEWELIKRALAEMKSEYIRNPQPKTQAQWVAEQEGCDIANLKLKDRWVMETDTPSRYAEWKCQLW